MTCAQGLLRLLWGGPKLECYGTAYLPTTLLSPRKPTVLANKNLRNNNKKNACVNSSQLHKIGETTRTFPELRDSRRLLRVLAK